MPRLDAFPGASARVSARGGSGHIAEHELYDINNTWQPYKKVAADIGLRLALLPPVLSRSRGRGRG